MYYYTITNICIFFFQITTMIEDKYRQCVETVNAMLSAVPDVAFTCDAVTVPNSSRSFLTVTAHFVYKESLNTIRLNSTRMDQVSLNLNICILHVFCRPLFIVFVLCFVVTCFSFTYQKTFFKNILLCRIR